MTQRPFHEIYEPRITTVTFGPNGDYTKHVLKESVLVNPVKDSTLNSIRKYEPTIRVYDAVSGRMEIPAGSGVIQVCVGFKKGRDEFGMRTEVPVYQTRRC